MNISLGLRTLALLAFVTASTAVIVKPDLLGSPTATAQAFGAVASLARA
ncbi:MAG TPA: hypothetical protein VFF16_02625 [Telluria sp.]|nr:hypothetical protein [Telluria sp.]